MKYSYLKKYIYVYVIILIAMSMHNYSYVYAEESPIIENNISNEENNNKIIITSKITNIYENVNNIFEYEIEPADDNNFDASGIPSSVVVEFKNIVPSVNGVAEIKTEFDFSNVTFKSTGIYKYIISEVKSENEQKYPLCSDKYEIYLVVKKINNEFKITVLDQILDLSRMYKTDKIEFIHEINEINQCNDIAQNQEIVKTGIVTFIMPYLILVIIATIQIFIIMKEKETKKDEDN